MTREEAIEILKAGHPDAEDNHAEYDAAVQVAVQSLEIDAKYDLAYESGKLPDDATNGDYIESIIPITDKWTCYNMVLDCKTVCIKSKVTNGVSEFLESWYNAPFKGQVLERW